MHKLVKDLKGQRFGKLVVQEYSGSAGKKGAIWRCLCDCGTHKDVLASRLKSGNTGSCGCMRGAPDDITGQRFGRLVALNYVSTTKKGATWRCKCDCGKERLAQARKLRNGKAQSCGCSKAKWSQERKNNFKMAHLNRSLAQGTKTSQVDSLQKYGNLTTWYNVTADYAKDPNEVVTFGKQRWFCKCKCGQFCIARTEQLVHKQKKSCGCGFRKHIAHQMRILEAQLVKAEANEKLAAEMSAWIESEAEKKGMRWMTSYDK